MSEDDDNSERAEMERIHKRMVQEQKEATNELMASLMSQMGGTMAAIGTKQDEIKAWDAYAAAAIFGGDTAEAAMEKADKLLEGRRSRFVLEEIVAAAMHGGKKKE